MIVLASSTQIIVTVVLVILAVVVMIDAHILRKRGTRPQ